METQHTLRDLSVYPILILEEYFPHKLRHKIFHILFPILSLLLALIVVSVGAGIYLPVDENVLAVSSSKLLPRITGLFFLLSAFWLGTYLLENFYRSIFFHNRAYKVRNKEISSDDFSRKVSSEVAMVFYRAKDFDSLRSLLSEPVGQDIFSRCGISSEDLRQFLEARKAILKVELSDLYNESIIDLEDLLLFIFKNYPEFSQFLFSRGVSEEDFMGAVEWAVREDEDRAFREKWWGRDNLKKINPVGRDFSFGHTYMLDKYAREITIGGASPSRRDLHWENEVIAVETALAKGKEANVMIIGDDGVGVMDVVYEFAYRVDSHEAPLLLQDSRILLVDTNLLVSVAKDKATLDGSLIRLLSESIRAGNIILVFDHFSSFVVGAKSLGTDVVDVMNPYLQSPLVHVIALSPTEEYHKVLAPNGEMITRFEVVQIKQPENKKIISLLEDGAILLERRYPVMFTYPGILEVLHSAENYITNGVMPDKATDLLMELPPYISEKGKYMIKKEDVLEFIHFKTKIPVGEIQPDERIKLTALETELHKRIVGQNDAINAISDSVRRARAGVRDPKKPTGSFLFLGPTGVGKTETAKALASIYFENEEKMSRLDMSEYQGEGSLERLIGSFESGKPGTLSMLVKNNPYGVLLLDEFEKTNSEVQNLFLQILDEGFFSDMGGHRINARNIIFIATSNAGSDLMYEAIQHGENIHSLRQYLIDAIIKKGTLKPELINRFDGVVLFSPLEKKDITEIAFMMAQKLKKRMHDEQSIDLVVNDPLVQMLVKEGQDPMFGARPMARAVKDRVEKIIAQKIISGGAKPGTTVELSAEELG